MTLKTERYGFAPRPFWKVVDAIEKAMSEELEGYEVSSDSRDDPVLTGEHEQGYALKALERESYKGVEKFARWPHKIVFEVPRTSVVDSIIVMHGRRGWSSTVYEHFFDDFSGVTREVVDDVYDRLER